MDLGCNASDLHPYPMLLSSKMINYSSVVLCHRLYNSSSTLASHHYVLRLLETQKTYEPNVVEESQVCSPLWRATMELRKSSESNKKKKFCMILPPPNITGELHLGHALTASIQDAICRWQFMKGRDVVWIPGLDHAGLATELVVERYLAKQANTPSITPRRSLGREAFIREILRWKDSKKASILDQLNRFGLLLDWQAEYFTFSCEHNKAVNEALCQISNAGLLYRAKSLISWCCYLQSAISDIEVEWKDITELCMLPIPGYDEKQPFGYVDVFDYKLSDGQERVPVATTRLETMLGDTALAVHPDDTRYAHLIGKFVEHPFVKNRVIPIIADAIHVDPNQGTGVVKVSPGHSAVDFEMAEGGRRLEVVNILTDDGNLNAVSEEFAGLPRFDARTSLAHRLSALGLYRGRFSIGETTDFLAKVAPMRLPICSRSGDIIEPLLREQWFIDTSTMVAAASEAVKSGILRISPHFHEATWCDWLSPERRRDWCISRQVWWGHRMPAYRIPEALRGRNKSFISATRSDLTSDWVIARNLDEARRSISQKCNCSVDEVPVNLEQDTDVLDTWFSSALLPLTAFGWPQESSKLSESYPLDLMETGQDIIFFWVARMAMLGIFLTGQIPFKHVFLHGLICDSNGQKMSKSKGNTIDPLIMIDGLGNLKPHQLHSCKGVRTLGADALRASLLATDFTKTAVVYVEECALDFRRFGNKVWQSLRFLTSEMKRFGVSVDAKQHSIEDLWTLHLSNRGMKELDLPILDEWFLERTVHLTHRFNAAFEGLCYPRQKNWDASKLLHNCVSDLRHWWIEDLCSVYLEVVKHRLRSSHSGTEKNRMHVLIASFLWGLRMLHPLMPHLSEVLWQSLFNDGKSILQQPYPKTKAEVTSIPSSNSHFVEAAIDAVSRLKSWRVLLQLPRGVGTAVIHSSDSFKTHSFSSTADNGLEIATLIELCSVLGNLNTTSKVATTPSFASIPCGVGISLIFDPKVVNFSAAKATLNFRLSKLVKKAEVGAKRDGIACGETPKPVVLERQINDLKSQLQILSDCCNFDV